MAIFTLERLRTWQPVHDAGCFHSPYLALKSWNFPGGLLGDGGSWVLIWVKESSSISGSSGGGGAGKVDCEQGS